MDFGPAAAFAFVLAYADFTARIGQSDKASLRFSIASFPSSAGFLGSLSREGEGTGLNFNARQSMTVVSHFSW
jgi:hypothetical protein